MPSHICLRAVLFIFTPPKVNEHGVVEPGIDGGGVFKVYLLLLILLLTLRPRVITNPTASLQICILVAYFTEYLSHIFLLFFFFWCNEFENPYI